jgi:hypothetical protein
MAEEGYRLQSRPGRITFDEDTPYHGLVIMCELDVPMALLFWFEDEANEGSQEALKKFGEEVLLSWNLQDRKDGTPIDATGEGMLQVPPNITREILKQWQEAVVAIPSPLLLQSLNGEKSEAGSNGTEASSPSPEPLLEQK